MVPLHSSVMMEHVPLYLDGSLSYISSRSFRPSSPTLERSDSILNTASILLSLHSLSPPRASTSPVSPRRPRHFPWPRSPRLRRLSKFIISSPPPTSPPPLCNSILHSFLFAHPLHFFLFLHSSLIPFDQPSTHELD